LAKSDSSCILRSMRSTDLEFVLAWRNHIDISRYMFSHHQISIEEHSNWFLRTSEDPLKHLLIFEKSRVPLGFVQITEEGHSGVAEWGFYTAPDSPRGISKSIGETSLDYVFNQRGLYRIYSHVIAHNEKSIRFHLRFGFQHEGTLRGHHFDGSTHQDIMLFGLLASEWLEQNRSP
jgi:UDP-4-amino-4,6-dideoxy-N-acetyl-beta-L-altrosamine N-acetyltransferase